MPVSAPLKTAAVLLRISPEEKARLERLARDRNVTLSHALREGARQLLTGPQEHGGGLIES